MYRLATSFWVSIRTPSPHRVCRLRQLNPMVDTSSLDLEIDKLVYQIYGLTEEEINIVESNL